MPLRAVTVDFWNTLVVAETGDRERRRIRIDRLASACRCGEREPGQDTLWSAYETARARFTDAWLGERHTPPTDVFVRWIWEELAVSVPAQEHELTVHTFRNVLLDHPPSLAPGALEAVRDLAERYPVAIISDTMLSPGSTIRELLRRYDLLDVFTSFVFSDESGCAKPDPRAFEAAASALGTSTGHLMHIGDLRPTDIAGALATGARAVLFTGIYRDDSDGPEPDVELRAWSDLPDLL